MSKQFIPFNKPIELTDVEMVSRSNKFHDFMKTRRTIRDFSRKEVPLEVIDNCLRTAGTAPSGANQQPWHFVVVRDASLKTQIRIAAEEEEKQFYAGRAGDTWLETLEHLGTDAHKPFLEEAPVLIAIFEQKYAVNEQGDKIKHYYAKESVASQQECLLPHYTMLGL